MHVSTTVYIKRVIALSWRLIWALSAEQFRREDLGNKDQSPTHQFPVRKFPPPPPLSTSKSSRVGMYSQSYVPLLQAVH